MLGCYLINVADVRTSRCIEWPKERKLGHYVADRVRVDLALERTFTQSIKVKDRIDLGANSTRASEEYARQKILSSSIRAATLTQLSLLAKSHPAIHLLLL